MALVVENLPASAGDTTRLRFGPSREDPLEGGMATHSRILVWRIPWTEDPGGLQSRHRASDTTERAHTRVQLHGAASAEPEQRQTD